MTEKRAVTPPRLAVALLECLGRRNDALAGDLLEGYQLTRSKAWLWRQLLWAIAVGGFRQPSEIRPLRLVDFPSWQPSTVDFSSRRRALQTRGLGASPIQDVGGIGLAAVVLLALLVSPSAFSIVGLGAVLGLVVGCIRVVIRHREVSAGLPTRHILSNAPHTESRRRP